MTPEQVKLMEHEFQSIKQSNMTIHAALTREFAERYEKAKDDKSSIDADGFVRVYQGGFKAGDWFTCDGWTMKMWIDSDAIHVVKPYFRLRFMGFTIYRWLHDFGPTETLSILLYAIHH